jgi:hypothetical protein
MATARVLRSVQPARNAVGQSLTRREAFAAQRHAAEASVGSGTLRPETAAGLFVPKGAV